MTFIDLKAFKIFTTKLTNIIIDESKNLLKLPTFVNISISYVF